MKGKAITLFLMVLAGMLTFYIYSQGFQLSAESKEVTTIQGEQSIRCVGYVYTVKNIEYDDNILKLKVQNELFGKYDISSVTIQGRETVKQDISVPRGVEKEVSLEIELEDSFQLYAEDCIGYSTTCSLQTGACRQQI